MQLVEAGEGIGLVLICGATIFGGMYVRIWVGFLVGFWQEIGDLGRVKIRVNGV